MSDAAREPLPPDLLAVDVGPRSVKLAFDTAAHPLTAVYGAAFTFLDRCWVVLDRPAPTRTRVTLALRASSGAAAGEDAAALDALVAEFAEELVSNTWRAGIEAETRGLVEGALSRAHGGGGGGPGDAPPSLDDLESYDFGADAMADPLGIALSWEKKHAPPKDP